MTTQADDQSVLLTQHRVAQFLYHEAALLDDRRFDEWLELFEPTGEYWVPMTPGQPDPYNHISLLFETVDVLKMRVRRLQDGSAPSQRPPSRTCHQIGNVMVAEGPDNGRVVVRSALTVTEYRRGDQRVFAGYARHTLHAHGASFRIAMKRVDILNCDSDAGHLRLSIPL